MIDTLILTIPNGPMKIWEHKDYWDPSVEGLTNNPSANYGAKLFTKYVCNMPKNKGYYPRLTITSRWNFHLKRYDTPLKIEFSAPKLMFGNNVDELTDTDFDSFIETLQLRLKEMGVMLLKREIENASITAVHFSKNIPLSGHYTPSQVIKVLQKLETTRQLQLNSKRFQNLGHAIYFDCSSYQIVVYDKVKDLNQTQRHSVDKDKIENQLSLFDCLTDKKTEIVRIEVRLVQKQKLNSLLKNLGYQPNPTLREVFNESLSKAVLSYFWQQIASDKNRFLLINQKEDPLTQLINYQKESGKKLSVIETLGLAHALYFANENGLNELRNALATHYSDRTWYRFQKNGLKKLNEIQYNKKYSYIKEVEDQLSSFVPYKMVN